MKNSYLKLAIIYLLMSPVIVIGVFFGLIEHAFLAGRISANMIIKNHATNKDM